MFVSYFPYLYLIFEPLEFFYWLSGIVKFTLLSAGYFWIPITIPELCSVMQ